MSKKPKLKEHQLDMFADYEPPSAVVEKTREENLADLVAAGIITKEYVQSAVRDIYNGVFQDDYTSSRSRMHQFPAKIAKDGKLYLLHPALERHPS